LGRWVRKHEADCGELERFTTKEHEKLCLLRRENRISEEEIAILSKATTFFARPQTSREAHTRSRAKGLQV